jgi:hypothetical protein
MRQIVFPNDAEFWYETQRSFGNSAYGGGDFGEVLVISEQITEGDYDSWYDAYLAAADRIAAEAADALRAGHRVSARDGLLRASNYYRSADFFLQGRPHSPPHYHAYDRSVECFLQAAALFTVPVQTVAIPYENTTLPGYFYSAGDPAVPAPLVITGYDGSAEEMHFRGAAGGAERGYNVQPFDGPGQGSLTRNQGMLFRPDWENVVGPVIDFALTLPGVDEGRIVLWGVSMGGVLAPRATAFEQRLAALVAVDGVYDIGLTKRKYAGEVPDFERRPRRRRPGAGRAIRPGDRGQPAHAVGDQTSAVGLRGVEPARGRRDHAGLQPPRRDRREDRLPRADLRRRQRPVLRGPGQASV